MAPLGIRVDAQPAAPPRVGLVAQGRNVNETDDHWVNGIHFQPESCGDSGTFDICDPGTLPDHSGADTIDFQPFGIWAVDGCSVLGSVDRDWQGRATRQLLACESSQIEAEFWRGDQAQASGYPNRYLADNLYADVLTAGPTSLTDALACLEEGLAKCNCGQRGMIHATRQAVTHWQIGGALRRDGNQIVTINDTIVVPGAGYDGSGPDGQAAVDGSVWAYATGMVDVRRSAILVIPDAGADLDRLRRDALRTSNNSIEVRAERAAAATWDGCCHFAVEINMSVCDFAGAGS